MAVGVSTTPNPAIILRPRHCFPLSPSASSPASLPFLRPQSRQRPPISMSRAGDSSSSSSSASCPPTGILNDGGLKITSPGVIGQNDLLIVGPGVLGRIVAEKWHKEHPACQIFGYTMTTDHHDELIKLGIIPSLKKSEPTNKFPFVIFCAPPTRTPDYPGDVRLAASNWSGEGSFLFTSSSAVYDCSDNGFCNEDSPVVPVGRSPRTDVLLKAENEALDIGGCVVRLAGLYISFMQFCRFSFKSITSSTDDCFLILMTQDEHYTMQDAASLSIAIMKKKLRGQVFLGCDNHPLSRSLYEEFPTGNYGSCEPKWKVQQEVPGIYRQSGISGTDGPLGKRMNNSKTRAEIGWEPKFTSFPQFLNLL
ncbi:hypothetical protein MUK42_17549 [Musa troglodytarum]|uniref:NAD(P)-binding Rossmann-fold superfamily protein n=1 Tax=Musa troglodytarum TaxID=320322 RepID=A0A9E7GWC9_9LILI|nr:hypothetical protein MUK42_17549 [Musa troglodytarum]